MVLNTYPPSLQDKNTLRSSERVHKRNQENEENQFPLYRFHLGCWGGVSCVANLSLSSKETFLC